MAEQRISGLDGLRAISIALVLFAHLGDGWRLAPYGSLGVSIFFVLSGFLITWLLCLEDDRYDSISMGRFYLRRALRILPPALLFLVSVQVLGWFKLADVAPGDFLHCALFVRNMTDGGRHTGHFWSLAIEEQFYLMWPLLFLLLGNNTRRLVFTGVLFAVSPVWYYIRVHHGASPNAFDVHAVYLLAGCMLALARHDARYAGWLSFKWLQTKALPPLAVLAFCFLNSPAFPIGCLVGAGNALTMAAGINYAVEHHGGFLNSSPMVWLGNLSYSLYLWQQVYCWRSELGWLGHFPANLAATVVAASFSFYLLERPLTAVRRRIRFIPNPGYLRLWPREKRLDVSAQLDIEL